MSDKMAPVNFSSLINHIFNEYKNDGSIFGISKERFFKVNEKRSFALFDACIETLIGPAAGPHTQLTQNIISAFLTGGRFFELKTVQMLDELKIDKPCIDTPDEAYNVEWSQELKLEQSFDEYIKAWMLLHILRDYLKLSVNEKSSFIFNMSVGYNLDGIKSERIDTFINKMKDARLSKHFEEYKNTLRSRTDININRNLIEGISPFISNSVTLSTMHGCPPEDIEAIAKYLIEEKSLHTYVKLNPTLLGYEQVREILDSNGFNYVELDKDSFAHDLQMKDAIPMLNRLQKFAINHCRSFGIKLSNTLGVNNNFKRLPGEQMYMSGRALFPLTINLAYQLAKEFDGRLDISFSGGASVYNTKDILETGIFPVTMVTELLKPGGYSRLYQIAENTSEKYIASIPEKINLKKLGILAEASLKDSYYSKKDKKIKPVKICDKLTKFDCFTSPCTRACPAHQNIPGYIRLVEQGKYTEALQLIMETNPLPHITGYICDHKCMSACTRSDYDSPVDIREIKKEAAVQGFNCYMAEQNSQPLSLSNHIKAAVIGAGPSGLSAAYYLRKAGFDVTVFEKSHRAGGTVQEIIPDFRITQEALDKDIMLIENAGVKFKFNCAEQISIERLKSEGFKYIYIAIGASVPNKFELKGQPQKRIYNAIDFLKNVRDNNPPELGRSVAVIGGGNSAMDAARAALRIMGVEKVYIIYRRTKEFMPADIEEFDNALAEGAVFKELLLPVEISGNLLRCQKMILSDNDEKGRRKVVPSENEYHGFIVNSVISAIGEHSDESFLKYNNLNDGSGNELNTVIKNTLTKETCIENVFAGGDVLRGPATVIEAVADGRNAAQAIIAKENINLPSGICGQSTSEIFEECEVIQRKGTVINEKMLNCSNSSLCLSCDLLCNKCIDVCPNRANIALQSENVPCDFINKYQILHLDASCNECGNCAFFCPHDGSPYKDKVTLFSSISDLLNSTNDGFCFERFGNSEHTVKYRFENQLGNMTIEKDEMILSSVSTHDSVEFNKFKNMIKSVAVNYSYLVSYHKASQL